VTVKTTPPSEVAEVTTNKCQSNLVKGRIAGLSPLAATKGFVHS